MDHYKRWNWQQDDWPSLSYKEASISSQEQSFLTQSGVTFGISKHISDEDKQKITIDLICNEAYKTSEIEGELLDRDSLQSSIKKHFGYNVATSRNHPREHGVAEMMIDLYYNFDTKLTHETMCQWHSMLMSGRRDISSIGQYRSHEEPMQVVSGYIEKPKIHFEAPPSSKMLDEMTGLIEWFNCSAPDGKAPLPALTRASITHLYFVTIHPFEDGNGRIARALVEKSLAQNLGRPTLIALSQIIQDHKKDYYSALEKQNKHNRIDDWLSYFADVILKAQKNTIDEIEFLIQKTKFYDDFKDQMNDRQQKAVSKILQQGTKGFDGGLSAKNYISITKTSQSTATRDLKDLVDKRIFKQTGSKKSTRYWLSMLGAYTKLGADQIKRGESTHIKTKEELHKFFENIGTEPLQKDRENQ